MIALAMRLLGRDWRGGELQVLALAIVTSVASLTCVSFLTDRVAGALNRDASRLLGADLVLSADAPWPPAVREQAQRAGLAVAESTTLLSMARHGDQAQLAALKAVSINYPLRGALRTATAQDGPDQIASEGPPAGEAWVEPRLLSLLGIAIGERLELGDRSFVVSNIITDEPDRGVGFFNIAPRVMIASTALDSTGLIQPGSRARYQIYLSGPAASLAGFRSQMQSRLGRGQSIVGLDNPRPEIKTTLQRAQRFIRLASLLAVLLSAVALALAVRRYARRHRSAYALMRCLGSSRLRLLTLAGLQLAVMSLAATALGCLIAYGAQAVLGVWLAQLGETPLGSASLWPLLQGCALTLILVLGCALPPVVRLCSVRPIQAIRNAALPVRQSEWAAYLVAASAIAGIVLWQADDMTLAAVLVVGLIAGLALIAGVATLAFATLARLLARGPASVRQAVRNLTRHRAASVLQACALTLALSVLLMLGFTRDDLLDGWRSRIPADAPNRFLLNVQPDQRPALNQLLEAAHLPSVHWWPMIRARLSAINGQPVDPNRYSDERSRRMVEREFNVSYALALPAGNDIVAGRAFDPAGSDADGLSIEEGIARDLGIHLGDRLDWTIAGQPLHGTVLNLRRLHWDSMQVNFFVIGTPRLLDTFTASFIASLHLPAAAQSVTARMVQQFPNLTVIDTSAIVDQLLQVIRQVSEAAQFLFLFALAAGLLVLHAALISTQDERMQDAAVMRALGASRAQLVWSARVECLAVGLTAGALAAGLAAAVGWVLAARVFEIAYYPSGWLWLAGPAVGLLCALWNAHQAAKMAMSRSPLELLRSAPA